MSEGIIIALIGAAATIAAAVIALRKGPDRKPPDKEVRNGETKTTQRGAKTGNVTPPEPPTVEEEASGPKRTIELLDELSKYGLSNDDFSIIHHLAPFTIKSMRDYCIKTKVFQKDGTNDRVRARLEIVLKKFLEGGYPHPAPAGVFRALCEDAKREIPMQM